MRFVPKQNTPTKIVLLPHKDPFGNAFKETWFRILKSEFRDRIIMFGQRSIENAVSGYVERYQRATIRQRLDNELIETEQDAVVRKMGYREKFGRMLKYCHRNAACSDSELR